MLVFDQRESDMGVAVLAKSDTRRDRHLGFLQQIFCEVDGAHLLSRLRDFRPDEHRPFWFRNFPAGALETVNQRIAPPFVHETNFLDAVLRPVESLDRGDLNRLENPVVEIALDARQRVNYVLVADAKTDAPAGHVVT